MKNYIEIGKKIHKDIEDLLNENKQPTKRCLFDIWRENQAKLPIHKRQNSVMLSCNCPKCSHWMR